MSHAENTPGSDTPSEPRFLLLGEVLRPHGIRGELRMRILTDYPERIAQLDQVYLADSVDSPDVDAYHVEYMRMHKGYGLLKLNGVNDRTQAEDFRELYVMVAFEEAIPLEEGEFYLFQLIGLEVHTDEGEFLGKITDIIETGANDVYVVNSPAHGEILIPVLDEIILEINIPDGKALVKLPDGLLP
jgi:16S rRNA processing protein RimM